MAFFKALFGFGWRTRVAERCGIFPQTLSMWTRRDTPLCPKYRARVEALALELGFAPMPDPARTFERKMARRIAAAVQEANRVVFMSSPAAPGPATRSRRSVTNCPTLGDIYPCALYKHRKRYVGEDVISTTYWRFLGLDTRIHNPHVGPAKHLVTPYGLVAGFWDQPIPLEPSVQPGAAGAPDDPLQGPGGEGGLLAPQGSLSASGAEQKVTREAPCPDIPKSISGSNENPGDTQPPTEHLTSEAPDVGPG